MKKRIYQQFPLILLIIISVSILATGCHRPERQRETIKVEHQFPNTNWTFEEQVLHFGFDNIDTVSDFRIEFYLKYDTTLVATEEIPVNITITAPDGMETFVSSVLNFDPKQNKDITPFSQGSVCSMKLVAFPQKHFTQKGRYDISFYRKMPKYDNLGFESLTLNVVPIK
ncbi:MAG: hypothetical protein II751_05965 [Bacteroidales bacterium]|nr:hypothetical protein [Bacteroidales bacterium]MBR6131644.1 hypothetical protein [Bacteroidales bacterium]MCR5549922.1 hypothetical protein [Bacteroidales bacterium]